MKRRGVLPKGSPPPWTIHESVEGTWGVRDANGKTVAVRLSEADARLVAQAPMMFKILDKLARHLKKVAPEALLISDWSEIGADAIDLVDALRVRKGVTKGLRPRDCRLRLGTPDQELGSNRRIPCPVTKEPHKPLAGSSNLPLATREKTAPGAPPRGPLFAPPV